MKINYVIGLLVVCLLSFAASLKIFRPNTRKPVKLLMSETSRHISQNMLVTSLVSTFANPIIAFADDGSRNAFIYPLAISFLTIVPFLLYQQ